MARKPDAMDHAGAAAAAMVAADAREAPHKDGLAWGLELHRWVEPKHWPRELEARVPPEHRAVAEEYLRGIAKRMRTLRELKAKSRGGPPDE